MLSIGKLVVGQQRYYEQQVVHGRDDYYSGRGEAPGEWAGAGARALGLKGRVSAEQFNALIVGADPRDPSARLRDGQDPKVAALDLTFSAPKSVSVLFAVAGEQTAGELIAAHEAAVRAAIGWIEDTVVLVRRGPQGHIRLPGEGLIAAAYRHRMSRALDPQLHTHVVAANLTRGPDGRFTALFGAPIYRAAKTGGYLYQAHLRAEISDRLGLEWGPVSKGAAELKDVPQVALEEFSRRRHEMQRAAAEGGFSLGSKRSAEAAAVDTRERKQYGVETHTWREEIQARAAEHGLGRDEVADMLERSAAQPGSADRPSDNADWPSDDATDAGSGCSEAEADKIRELADQLAGPAGLTKCSNTFDDRAVLQEFAQAAGQGARVATVRVRASRFGQRDDVFRTRDGGMTTADLVDCERQLIDSTVSRADERCAIVPGATIDRAISGTNRRLTGEQEQVVRGCASSGHGVDVVEARAGTGKTYTAGVLRSLYESAGYRVIGLAPTGRGARELGDEAGIAACTIDRALIDIEQLEAGLREGAVIVLDEAGMAPTRLTARLLEHAARAGAKVIAIGDSGQLPSVLAGGWLRAVGDRIGALELTEVMRQRDPGERRALGALHDGLPNLYVDWATATDRIDVVPGDRIAEHAVGEWIEAAAKQLPGQAVMIARDNETRARLNELARAHRDDADELGTERTYGGTPVAVGDRVICRDNDARVGVDNGTRGTVRHVDGRRVVLETDGGAARELPASYVADHVEHAYCLTGHGMQGGTVERAFVVASPEDLTAGWSYSALSRARGATRLLLADTDRREAARTEHAPEGERQSQSRSAVIARAARRMLVRDDEDLAVDQLSVAGREDDRSLATHRASAELVPQEAGARRAEPIEPVPTLKRLLDLREQMGRLRLTLGALPTRPLARFEELDAKAREHAAQRAERDERLDALKPPARRLGRVRDPDADERAFLKTAIEVDDRTLADLGAERARLQRELGDPDQVKSERDGIENALRELRRDHDQVRDVLAEQSIERRPGWLIDALGQRPGGARGAETWDGTAHAVATFRLDHDVVDDETPLGPEPGGSGNRREWQQANAVLERARRQLGRESSPCDRGVDLGIG
ncbi:MAG: MobF family relaxase [Solirubrobacteraceae bacterium]